MGTVDYLYHSNPPTEEVRSYQSALLGRAYYCTGPSVHAFYSQTVGPTSNLPIINKVLQQPFFLFSSCFRTRTMCFIVK